MREIFCALCIRRKATAAMSEVVVWFLLLVSLWVNCSLSVIIYQAFKLENRNE